jgi:DNA invertase Pin-like site-specific DNA recombinase
MKIGYARTSTTEQVAGLEVQIRELEAAGIEKLFQEQLSSVDAKRPELAAVIEFARRGDTLIVTKLDRLARSVANLVEIEAALKAKDVHLQILNLGIDTGTPTGRLNFNILAAVAQFEREIMLERQREGIAKAKGEGKYKGRAPTARSRADRVVELAGAGLRAEEIAAKLSAETNGRGKAAPISVRSVFRILAAEKARANG